MTWKARWAFIVAIGVLLVGSVVAMGASGTSGCKSIPPVLRLSVNSFYSDSQASVPDKVKFEQHQQALQPLRDFRDLLAKAADDFILHRTPPSACAILNLTEWVQAHSLAGESRTNEEVYEKTRFIFSIAVAAAHLRNGLEPKIFDQSAAWLAELARQNIEDFPKFHGEDEELYLWEGAMAAAMFHLTSDEVMRDYALKAVGYADRTITSDGIFLPAMERGQRSTIYQLSSLDALIFIRALLANANDSVTLSEVEQRLLVRTVEGVQHPIIDEAIAHAKQESIEDRSLAPVEAVDDAIAEKLHPVTPGYLFGGDPKLWMNKRSDKH